MADIPESTKMLPCPNPWCENIRGVEAARHILTAKWHICCGDCLIDGPWADTCDLAIAAWNTRAAPPAMDREAVVLLKGGADDPYSFSGDEDEDGFVISQHRFYKWGDDCVIAIGELNTPNTWDDEAFDAKCQTLLSTLSADAIRQGEGKYLVWSNEHRAWWGPDERGYTRIIERAGRYDRDKAFSISSKRGGGWQREENPDEIAIPEADAIAQYTGPSIATPASHASDGGQA